MVAVGSKVVKSCSNCSRIRTDPDLQWDCYSETIPPLRVLQRSNSPLASTTEKQSRHKCYSEAVPPSWVLQRNFRPHLEYYILQSLQDPPQKLVEPVWKLSYRHPRLGELLSCLFLPCPTCSYILPGLPGLLKQLMLGELLSCLFLPCPTSYLDYSNYSGLNYCLETTWRRFLSSAPSPLCDWETEWFEGGNVCKEHVDLHRNGLEDKRSWVSTLPLSIVVTNTLPVDSWQSPHAEFCNSSLLLGVISSRQPSEDILNCKLPAHPRHGVSMATVTSHTNRPTRW